MAQRQGLGAVGLRTALVLLLVSALTCYMVYLVYTLGTQTAKVVQSTKAAGNNERLDFRTMAQQVIFVCPTTLLCGLPELMLPQYCSLAHRRCEMHYLVSSVTAATLTACRSAAFTLCANPLWGVTATAKLCVA